MTVEVGSPQLLPVPDVRPNRGRKSAAPVVVLSYSYSGADLVQRALADGGDLACTAGTGILPLCEAAAATWARVEQRPGRPPSRLAAGSIRALVGAQITTLTSEAGRRRWCELATASPNAAQAFLEIFPEAGVVCVHRACTDVIGAAVAAKPWGLVGEGMGRHLLDHAGNSVAAVAAYWVSATEQLLAFESAEQRADTGRVFRVLYEKMTAEDGVHRLDPVKSALDLTEAAHDSLDDALDRVEPPAREPAAAHLAAVPIGMIPAALRKNIDRLHARLGYPPLPEAA